MTNTTHERYSVRESRSRWLALKLNIEGREEKTVEREPEEGPRPIVSAVEGLPGGLLRKPDIATARRMMVRPRNLLGGRRGML
jgi:hypothetical protein